jgi:hypothetical protein
MNADFPGPGQMGPVAVDRDQPPRSRSCRSLHDAPRCRLPLGQRPQQDLARLVHGHEAIPAGQEVQEAGSGQVILEVSHDPLRRRAGLVERAEQERAFPHVREPLAVGIDLRVGAPPVATPRQELRLSVGQGPGSKHRARVLARRARDRHQPVARDPAEGAVASEFDAADLAQVGQRQQAQA